MILYIGINETKWNHHEIDPSGPVCVAPVYGRTERTHKENCVRIPNTPVLQDSGAFSDGPLCRLDFKESLERQIAHAAKYKYAHLIEAVASYDLLIDEKWQDGKRSKRRWDQFHAELAVDETVNAARYLSEHRYCLPYSPRLVLSAQGVTPNQYAGCVRRILPFFESRDILGLGGWCILGQRKSYLPDFYETIRAVIPLVSDARIGRVHIWGVLYAPAIGALLWMCDKYGIVPSTDSSGPSVRPARGVWGYMGWVDKNYKRPPVETRGRERVRHVRAVRNWLKNFRETEYYKEPPRKEL